MRQGWCGSCGTNERCTFSHFDHSYRTGTCLTGPPLHPVFPCVSALREWAIWVMEAGQIYLRTIPPPSPTLLLDSTHHQTNIFLKHSKVYHRSLIFEINYHHTIHLPQHSVYSRPQHIHTHNTQGYQRSTVSSPVNNSLVCTTTRHT